MWTLAYELARSIGHRLPISRKTIANPVFQRIKKSLRALAVSESPDRLFMKKYILPALAARQPARILFVGCQAYTARYDRWFDVARTEYWTIDIDPASKRFGSPTRHVVDGVENLETHFQTGFFDIIVLNGVIGFGLDEPAAIARALRACHATMQSGGVMLVGWNTDRIADPFINEAMQACFAPCDALGFGSRRNFANCTHVYDVCVAV